MVSKIINSSGFGLILLCFILPFMSIKCMQVKIVEVSPLDILMDNTIKKPAKLDEMLGKYKSYDYGNRADKETDMPEIKYGWSKIAALLLLVVSLIAFLISIIPAKPGNVTSIVFASIIFVAIIFLAVSVSKLRYEAPGMNSADMGFFSIGFSIGFWLMLFSAIGLIVYNAIAINSNIRAETLIPQPIEPLYPYTPPPVPEPIVVADVITPPPPPEPEEPVPGDTTQITPNNL